MTDATEDMRRAALAAHMQTDLDDIDVTSWDELAFEAPMRSEWLVLTDEEADERAAASIGESLWAFVPGFLSGETGLPEHAFSALSGMCEDANDTVRAMVDATCGFDKLVSAAIGADGRGRFLAGYDWEENDETVDGVTFYLYRTN